jgi:hypothetical protein
MFALAAVMLLTGSVRAQGVRGLEVGAGVAMTTNPVETLSGASCPAGKTWATEGRLAWRFSRVVALEGSTALHWESGEDCVERDPPLPLGPFERDVRDYPGGYPFTTSDVRLAFEPSSPSGTTWFRAFGGWGYMWGKKIPYWLAGGGVVFGGRIRFVLDAEWKWFDVPFDSITQSFLDAALISEEITDTGEDPHTTFAVKLGFRLML